MNTQWTRSVSLFLVFAVAVTALVAGPAFGGADAARTSAVATAKDLGNAFADVAAAAKPAVVFIRVEAQASPASLPEGMPPELRRFLPPQAPTPVQGQGSGFVISSDGHVLTNNHVVKDATRVTVRFADGRELPAKVVGTDPTTDVALIDVEGEGFPYLELADSDRLRVGEWVVAIGNPFGLTQTVTAGIVSAKGRNAVGINDLEDFIQTDAAINPGNSGGPLLDLDGHVVGINSAIYSRSGGNVGIGFAVPANLVRTVRDRLLEDGKVSRGWLGVVIQELTPELAPAFGVEGRHGALVAEVQPDGPAASAGVEPGDLLVAVDGKPAADVGSLRNAVGLRRPGETVHLDVLRDGKRLDLAVRLAARPGATEATSAQAEVPAAALGLRVEPLDAAWREKLDTQAEAGLVITSVAPDSAAARAGLRPGMVILGVDHEKATSIADLVRAQEAMKGGRPVLLRVLVDGAARWVALSAD